MSGQPHEELGLIGSWWQAMMKESAANKIADPNYFSTQPEMLQSEAHLEAFAVGNGDDIYHRITPAIEQATTEVVLITCFWAKSTSLDQLCASLRRLSDRVVANNEPKVRVFIGFSSASLFQKLFHTPSTRGKDYTASQMTSKLGLPSASELTGLDIQIKSIFVLPFSVMHPKFVIIDRKLVFLPSCNVSWESWFEGCITMSGPIVEKFVTFWKKFWLRAEDSSDIENGAANGQTQEWNSLATSESGLRAAHSHTSLRGMAKCPAIFLPSPHHMNPRFTFPWQSCGPAPPTPLNLFLLGLLDSATRSVYMQTPNLTSPPVLKHLLKTLRRGIDVHVLTSERLMILEQLVTAGTTTARCVKKLIKLYKRGPSSRIPDEEAAPPPPGNLRIEYYEPKDDAVRGPGEPVQSHLKLTVVDDLWVVLGSGNMDRASWFTSQELGVGFQSSELAKEVRRVVGGQMAGRTKIVFDSSADR